MIKITPIISENLPNSISLSWQKLHDSAPYPKYQYDFAYMSSWCQYMRDNWMPIILIISENFGSSVISTKGIVPLMFRNEKRRGILPYRRLRFLGHDQIDYSTILSRNDDLMVVTRSALHWLFHNIRWELLILDDLVDKILANYIETFLIENKIKFRKELGKYYYINLRHSIEDIKNDMNKKFIRRNLNNAYNKINKIGNWEVRSNPFKDVDEVIDTAGCIYNSRQKQLNRKSVYSEENYRKFLKNVITHMNSKKQFRSYWLVLNNKYIAYTFAYEEDNRYYGWQMAFDPKYAFCSPTKILLYESILNCRSRGLDEFNFGRGESAYKSMWTKNYRVNHRYVIYNNLQFYGKLHLTYDLFMQKIFRSQKT